MADGYINLHQVTGVALPMAGMVQSAARVPLLLSPMYFDAEALNRMVAGCLVSDWGQYGAMLVGKVLINDMSPATAAARAASDGGALPSPLEYESGRLAPEFVFVASMLNAMYYRQPPKRGAPSVHYHEYAAGGWEVAA
jgi:hypothetical protein